MTLLSQVAVVKCPICEKVKGTRSNIFRCCEMSHSTEPNLNNSLSLSVIPPIKKEDKLPPPIEDEELPPLDAPVIKEEEHECGNCGRKLGKDIPFYCGGCGSQLKEEETQE